MTKLENGEWLCPCKKCGGTPRVIKYDELYYVIHRGYITKKIRRKENGEYKIVEKEVPCDKWPKYEFCAVNENQAIRNWYWANMHGYRDIEDIYS